MIWLTLSLLTALTVAIRDTSVKKMASTLSPFDIAALELFWSLPFFAIALVFTPVPHLDAEFWHAYLWSFPLNWSAYFLYIIAISIAPLSLTVPLLAFTPVFIILTGAAILGEEVTLWGGLGIMLITASSYLLNFDKIKDGFWAPIKAIFVEKGSFMMLTVAFIFSFAAVIGKKGMQHSSPLFFGFFFFLLCNLSMLGGLFITGKASTSVLKMKKYGLWLGSLFFCHILFHSLAIIGIAAAYMISIKRSSILFSVLLGWLLFQEKHIRLRGPAALLMFIGAVLITLYG